MARSQSSHGAPVALAVAALLGLLAVALASASDGCRASLQNPHTVRVYAHTITHICFANGRSVDTHAQPALAHHAKLRARQSSPGPHDRHRGQSQHNVYDQPRVYLVHVGAPLTVQARAAIESHAGVALGGYIPHHSYFVTATPSQAERLRTAPGVQWIDAHHPEHKARPRPAAGLRA
eukprot:tig00000147_g9446.t1